VRLAGRIDSVRPKLIPPQSEFERHVQWRSRCLREAGFERSTAQSLARDTDFDLHALLELVDRDCPPELALRIVAPLDWKEVVP
jgi:hypothetical protein